MLNDAVEDGELWQFLRLDRKQAVRYRELADGKYEIIEERSIFWKNPKFF